MTSKAAPAALAIALCAFAGCSPSAPSSETAKPAAAETGPQLSHDSQGNPVVTLTPEIRKVMEIKVEKPTAAQWRPELKAFGRVMDPATLIALVNELATTQAAYAASSNELARLQTLAPEGNASARVLQTAEATAARDQLAVRSARDRLALNWGEIASSCSNLPALVPSLAALRTVLIRTDLTAGEALASPPETARFSTLAGQTFEALFLGRAPVVDPLLQAQGLVFKTDTNAFHLVPGQALTAHLIIPGEPLNGVAVPRAAVVRSAGAGWVYLSNAAGDSFTRIEIPLDRPTENGWFIGKGVGPDQNVVVAGAQQLLSFELKGQSSNTD